MDFNITAFGQVNGFMQYADPPEGGNAASALFLHLNIHCYIGKKKNWRGSMLG